MGDGRAAVHSVHQYHLVRKIEYFHLLLPSKEWKKWSLLHSASEKLVHGICFHREGAKR